MISASSSMEYAFEGDRLDAGIAHLAAEERLALVDNLWAIARHGKATLAMFLARLETMEEQAPASLLDVELCVAAWRLRLTEQFNELLCLSHLRGVERLVARVPADQRLLVCQRVRQGDPRLYGEQGAGGDIVIIDHGRGWKSVLVNAGSSWACRAGRWWATTGVRHSPSGRSSRSGSGLWMAAPNGS